MHMRDPKIVRTKLDEDTTFIYVQGRSRNREEIDSFTTELVQSLADWKPLTSTPEIEEK